MGSMFIMWVRVQSHSTRKLHRFLALFARFPIHFEHFRQDSIARLLPGLTGYLTSLAALVGTEDIDDTVGVIGQHLRDYEAFSHTQVAERVTRRTSELELR